MVNEAVLRAQLAKLLDGQQAHADLKNVVRDIPLQYRSKKVRGLPYSLWDLLEHIRLSQRDILNYVLDPNYEAGHWPDDYWPMVKNPTGSMWDTSVKGILGDLRKLKRLIRSADLFGQVKGGKHPLLREILIIADHNAYHLGQMVVLRRLLGSW